MGTKTKPWKEKVAPREVKKKVEILLRDGNYPEAIKEIEAFSKGYTAGEEDLDWAEILVMSAFAKEKMGRYEEARRDGEEAYKALRLTDRHKEVGRVQRVLGTVYLALGPTQLAYRYLRNSLSTFERIRDKIGRMHTLNILGQSYFMEGRLKEALDCLKEILELSREEGRRYQEALILGNIGTIYRKMGHWKEAEETLRSNLGVCQELNDVPVVSHTYISLARLLIMRRDFDEAEELLERAEALSQAYPKEMAMISESLGDLAAERGQLQRAKEYYQRTLEIGRKIAPQGDLINQVQRRRAELLIAEGKDLEEASECVQEALRISLSLGDKFEEGCCYRTMGKLSQAKGDSKSAQANYEKAVKVLRSIEDRLELANTLLVQGESSGRLDLLREAHTLFTQIQGAEFHQALALLQIARVESSSKGAVESLKEAEEIFRARGEAERLKEVEALKIELNQRLKSFQDQKYQVLQGLSSEDLGSVFGKLIEEVGADRGFLAYAGDGKKKMEVGASHNLSEEETKEFLSLLADGNSFEVGRPSILYDASLDKRFSAIGAYSIMLTPLGNEERIEGFLYVDRRKGKEPFLERELDLFSYLSDRVAQAIGEKRRKELERANQGLRQRLTVQGMTPEEIITQNEKMLEILRKVDRSKDYKTTVLIKGESGTGKELVAQRIHFTSLRNTKRFVPIDCGAIPDDLFEAEVFGCEKGAFTGAVPRKGLIEWAEGGTLFLDEVGNLSLSHQAKLLRVLEDGKLRRLGGNRERDVDVRVIAATNKVLTEEIKKGRFREDLYYRFKQIVLGLPPLRERRDDIRLLAHHFLEVHSRQCKKRLRGITEEALKLLEGYPWPGNVRELKNEMERAVLMADDGEEITPELLSKEIKAKRSKMLNLQLSSGRGVNLKEIEREAIQEALKKTKGAKYEASKLLGIGKSTLYRKVKEYGLS